MGSEWPEMATLELLVGIDDRGSLGAASRQIGMAQPNASRAIRQLESRFGTALVQRSPRGSTLTAQGTVIVHWARQVLADMRQLVDAADALRVEQEAELTIASSLTVAEYLLPEWLGEFRRANSDVHIHLQMLNSMQVFDRIDDRSCDVGFVEGPAVPDHLNKITVAKDRLIVVVHPSHKWARRRRPLTVAELAATPLLAREPGSGTRRTLDLALQEYDRPAPLLELASSAAIRASVLGGVGPAVMSTLAVADQVASGELSVVDIEGVDLSRTLRAVWRQPRRLSGPAGDLLKSILRENRNRQ
ncbi:LysR substrate-binding domain-containing protein [Antrihabitans sp. YC2-6]|uniref:LysR substrate-binding domain-containing protein n=1 Tax=Antrihabitans sp. YC2-6 TaxID=2799498 RepID=UPI0018F3A83D|nr:LysR substrate-binding domain-containing protein [Antrihabitans sp. YC2-6]MBJ8345668.1 LysR family transcriptional regulator [Antrihabitans sp. YC2-6]